MTRKQEFWVNTTDQQKLYVKTWGDETLPPLVLVHGYPDNQETWEPIIPFLSDQFYVITYDVRGAGSSSVPASVKSYRLPQLADDLESVVNQVIPDRSYHLAAHDWGSIQSWESVTEPRFRGKILSYSTISGPCLDHATFALTKLRKKDPAKWMKLLSKSWYIGIFHLPLLAPTFWRFSSEKFWQKFLTSLERQQGLPINSNISRDGQFGVQLYRANFLPALAKPRKRYAQCPVQAIVLKYDRFVSPDYIEEMPNWVDDFSQVEVDANHWAILSQPEKIANYIATFAQKYS
ncbi:MAG: alpha/beta fold hydrolase [Acinetobacter populi]|uniref:alpha/beta fold hydrolase n=1 Tax=Acinetobacter populi TaxID=1582270 RepID=UPI00235268F3|nr:alpha/beta fold hydrolase [Acinetobacter populi]MCH4248148.1 alpha/beta fold hydrolase [Acinetobacter populi]